MKRNLLLVAVVVAVWGAVVSVVDHRRAKQRRDLWAETTRDNATH